MIVFVSVPGCACLCRVVCAYFFTCYFYFCFVCSNMFFVVVVFGLDCGCAWLLLIVSVPVCAWLCGCLCLFAPAG